MGLGFALCQELLFVFTRAGSRHGHASRSLLSFVENELWLSSPKAPAGERGGSAAPGGGGKKHLWDSEDSLSPSFPRELKLCQFISNPSDWHFTLKPHSEEWSPLEVRDISNKSILNAPLFLCCKATASPSECSCWTSFCSTQEAAE